MKARDKGSVKKGSISRKLVPQKTSGVTGSVRKRTKNLMKTTLKTEWGGDKRKENGSSSKKKKNDKGR